MCKTIHYRIYAHQLKSLLQKKQTETMASSRKRKHDTDTEKSKPKRQKKSSAKSKKKDKNANDNEGKDTVVASGAGSGSGEVKLDEAQRKLDRIFELRREQKVIVDPMVAFILKRGDEDINDFHTRSLVSWSDLRNNVKFPGCDERIGIQQCNLIVNCIVDELKARNFVAKRCIADSDGDEPFFLDTFDDDGGVLMDDEPAISVNWCPKKKS